MLAAHGITARVLGDDLGGAVPYLTMGTRGYALDVAAQDQEEATALLHPPDEADLARATPHPPAARRAGIARLLAGLVLAIILVGLAWSYV